MSFPEAPFRARSSEFQGQLLWDEPLAKYTYYKLGGPARLMAVPKDLADLEWLSAGIRESGAPFFIMGLASNLLVSDSGFDGVVVRASRLDQSITEVSSETVRTGSGVAVSTLLGRATREGWGGLEFLTGVPGSIGGVVTMNAGTSTGETKDRLQAVTVFDLKTAESRTYPIGELSYVYRENQTLTSSQFILSADWRVTREDASVIKARIDKALEHRKKAQPTEYPSCGSVFRNPGNGVSAWQVIEKLGLKGHRLGGAQFSEKHANFIINHGNARASEVHELIELAKSRAKTEFTITLREEVIRVGEF